MTKADWPTSLQLFDHSIGGARQFFHHTRNKSYRDRAAIASKQLGIKLSVATMQRWHVLVEAQKKDTAHAS